MTVGVLGVLLLLSLAMFSNTNEHIPKKSSGMVFQNMFYFFDVSLSGWDIVGESLVKLGWLCILCQQSVP